MSAQELEVIDHTVQLTHEWINELRDRLGWTSSRDALRLLRQTMTQIRDHLGHDEVAQFAAQMPLLIRGMFYEGWRPSHTPVRERKAEDFIAAVGERLDDMQDWRGVEDIVAVFRTLDNRISEGELRDVKAGLPRQIRDLWPD
ncbi:DUF2267 domain-containing protein [Maribius pontilimi]|uniref:DUF2267 domain-containing protein n=1 Tax=Palleronia pontilimi TaxID=1964209 RepID=A0A934MAJ3_9RHOB|nr:DUF2267 domain-containing protein [Palleronia pontilimi]MBJ3763697.1 DUF2267 domain-containing protein [Palleronia pontilimi]